MALFFALLAGVCSLSQVCATTVSIGTTCIMQCESVTVHVWGGTGPYVVDAIRINGQQPMGLVNLPPASQFQQSDSSVSWENVIASGTAFAIRAIDANGVCGISDNICVNGDLGIDCGAIVQGSAGGNECSSSPSPAPPPPPPSPCPEETTTTTTEPPCESGALGFSFPEIPALSHLPDYTITTTIWPAYSEPTETTEPCETSQTEPPPSSSPPYSIPEPGLPIPDADGLDMIMLPLQAARWLYEKMLFECLAASLVAYWALL